MGKHDSMECPKEICMWLNLAVISGSQKKMLAKGPNRNCHDRAGALRILWLALAVFLKTPTPPQPYLLVKLEGHDGGDKGGRKRKTMETLCGGIVWIFLSVLFCPSPFDLPTRRSVHLLSLSCPATLCSCSSAGRSRSLLSS